MRAARSSRTRSTSRRIDPGPLVTRTVGLTDLDETFAASRRTPDDIKVLVDPTL